MSGIAKTIDVGSSIPGYVRLYHEQVPKPWFCLRCGEEVERWGGPDDDRQGVIHHRDHNHFNDDLANLAAMHRGCHNTHHLTGHAVSAETRTKIGIARRRLADRSCAQCGTTFRPVKANRPYCSPKCGTGSKRKRCERTCPRCGASFIGRPKGSSYCSPSCGNAAKRDKTIARNRSVAQDT